LAWEAEFNMHRYCHSASEDAQCGVITFPLHCSKHIVNSKLLQS